MKNLILTLSAVLITISILAQSSNKRKANIKKSDKVLLITSAQVDLLSENGKAWGFTKDSEEFNQVRKNLAKIILKAREQNIPIIHSPVGFDYDKMEEYQPLNAIQGVIVENQLLAINTSGVDFIPEAQPLENEIVLPFRQGFSSFWAKSIQKYLEKLGVKTIYIAGMLAEGCVESHSRDAAENGYTPIVISNAIGSTSLDLLEASKKTLSLYTSAMISADEFLKSEK